MADPYLLKDESVILATSKVMFRSVSLPALILTNKRILLIQTDGDKLSADEILLSKLRTAEIDEYATMDPVLMLSYVTGTGEVKQETLTFSEKDKKQRKEECGEWARKLNEQILPSLGEEITIRIPPSAKEPVRQPAAEPVSPVGAAFPAPAAGEESAAPPKTATVPPFASSPGEILAKHARLSGLTFPSMPPVPPELESPAPAPRRKLISIVTLVLVILAVVAGAFLCAQYLPVKPGGSSGLAVTTPAITTVATTVPTPVPTTPPTLTPTETVSPTPSPPQVLIPQTGVWVRVQYAGNFTGSIGEGANFRPVSGTGERFYQLATKTGIAKAIFQKQDGSGNLLTVDIYQNGASIQHRTTTAPKGEVNIQIEVKAASPTVTVMPNVTVTNVTMQKPEGTN